MKKVSLYTTPTCVYCKSVKELFKEFNVQYDEYNVATDLAKRQEMVDISGQLGVPVIKIDEEVIVGFDRKGLIKSLGVEEKK